MAPGQAPGCGLGAMRMANVAYPSVLTFLAVRFVRLTSLKDFEPPELDTKTLHEGEQLPDKAPYSRREAAAGIQPLGGGR